MKDLADELYFDEDDIKALRGPAVAYEIAPTVEFPDFASSLFIHGEYPAQIGAIDQQYEGEIQGTYGDKWRPSSSVFGYVRKDTSGKPKKHSAVDIYAPKGTPVVATADGSVVHKPQVGGEAIGNRAWLYFDVNGEQWRFIYAHLDRFEGKPGKVKRGDVLGYSGCSGNAMKVGCGTKNKCGLVPDHVHLMLMTPKGIPVDPLIALKWKLKYLTPEKNNVDCKTMVKTIPA